MDEIRIALPRPCSVDWDALTERGRDRHCALCSTTVIDVEHRSAGELEDILRSPGKHCVRVRLDRQGAVRLAPNAGGSARKFVATVGIGAALMAGATPLAAREGKAPEGAIEGRVVQNDWRTRAEATSADGTYYSVKVRRNGKFKFKHLPPGIYQLSYMGACTDPWKGDAVVVEAGKVTRVTTVEDDNNCVIIGVVEIVEDRG